MKEGWSRRWKALLIWASGYISFIAFAIVGGYVIVRSDDEELKDTVKKAFVVTLIFTVISMFFTLYSSIGGLSSGYYSSGAYVAYGVLQLITTIAKIIVYVVFALLSFFNVKAADAKTGEKPQMKSEAEFEETKVEDEKVDNGEKS